MDFCPQKILEDFCDNRINLEDVFELFIYILENSKDEYLRINTLKALRDLKPYSDKVYFVLENLMLSDSQESLRRLSFEIINKEFPTKKIFDLVLYAIRNEKGAYLIELIEYLAENNAFYCKHALITKLLTFQNSDWYFSQDFNSLATKTINQLRLLLFKCLFNESTDVLYFHGRKNIIALDIRNLDII